MSELNVGTIKNSAGTHEYFPCTAWVNFNGTGVVAVRDSGNVSSITDNGVGDYTVNFSTAMDNANYSLGFATTPDTVATINGNCYTGLHGASTTPTKKDVNGYRILTLNTTPTGIDTQHVLTQAFGGLA